MKKVTTLKEGATYHLPTHIVTNDGLISGEGIEIRFCKGSTQDESVFRQEGVFVEHLLKVSQAYLQSVNTGELANRQTSIAITKIQEAVMWLENRQTERLEKGVLTTYKP